MADSPAIHPVKTVPDPVANDRAPFIYFDGAFAYGVTQGAVQIELGAHTIVPSPGGINKTRDEPIVTAHLRCSPAAAEDLLRAIQGALDMFKKPEGVAH